MAYRLIVDYEGSATCRPYNLGLIVFTKSGEIVERHNFVFLDWLPENINAKKVDIEDSMFNTNYKSILFDTNNYEIGLSSHFKPLILDILKVYDIKEVWQYGNFDQHATKRLFGEKVFTENPLLNRLQWYNIQTAILFTRLLTKKYVKYCVTNGFVTDKNNLKTSAEVVFGYLTNNPDFVEKHNGLDDCVIELYILQTAIKRGRKFKFDVNPSAYIQLKQFCLQFTPPLEPYNK